MPSQNNTTVPFLVDCGHRVCPVCQGRGETYAGQNRHDPNVELEVCWYCEGKRIVPDGPEDPASAPWAPEREDPDDCPKCGSVDLRYISITSKEPHGEQFTDEGWRCTRCGTIVMHQEEPKRNYSSGNLLNELMRSLVLAKNLDPAFRLGIALSIPRKPAGSVTGPESSEKGAA